MKKPDDWEKRFHRWIEPFVNELGDKRRRKWAPLYLLGLLLPGERKSIQPISARTAPSDGEQVHHFVATSSWDTAPVEAVLCEKADALIGGERAHLIVDDTALPKKGTHSVGVAHQYCGALGKQANCQSLVSLTLSRDEIPIPIALRLYLPKAWADDRDRCDSAKVPSDVGYRPKWQIALDEIARVQELGVRFEDVLADAGYGMCAEFRHGLTALGLSWTVGIVSTQNVYAADTIVLPVPSKVSVGRKRINPTTSSKPSSAAEFVTANSTFRKVTWRTGTKGKLTCRFAFARIRPADGKKVRDGVHLPTEPCWLVCEWRENGERKYYLSNLPESSSEVAIVRAIKARWACEQGHQQMKEELGLDHFEGRSWFGLHHHAVLTMIAFAFLQTERLSENKNSA